MFELKEFERFPYIRDSDRLCELFEHIYDDVELSEEDAKAAVKIICNSICNHLQCHKALVTKCLRKLALLYGSTVDDLFFITVYKNVRGLCSTARLCSYCLDYMNALFQSSGVHVTNSRHFTQVVELYALLSNGMATSSKYNTRAVQKLRFLWNEVPDSFHLFMDKVCKFSNDLKYLFLVGAMEEFAAEKHIAFECLMVYTADLFKSVLIKSLSVSEETLYPCKKSVERMANTVFEVIVPDCNRSLLRSPRTALTYMKFLLQNLNFKMDSFAESLFKPLSLHLISKEEDVQNLSHDCFLALMAKCSEPKTHESLARYLFSVFEGSLGAITLLPQKKMIFTLLGNIKPPFKIFDHSFFFVLQKLLSVAFDKTSAESLRICVLEQLKNWCLITAFSQEFFNNLMKSMKDKGISPMINCTCILIFKSIYSKDQKYVSESALPSFLLDIIKKDRQHTSNAENTGAILVAFDLLTQMALDFPNDSKLSPVWPLFVSKETAFLSHPFFVYCPVVCFQSVFAMYLRLVSSGKVVFNMLNWSMLVICCLYRMDHNTMRISCEKFSRETGHTELEYLFLAVYKCITYPEIRSVFGDWHKYSDVIRNLFLLIPTSVPKGVILALCLACSSLNILSEDRAHFCLLNGLLKSLCEGAEKYIIPEYALDISAALLSDEDINEAQRFALMYLTKVDHEHFGEHVFTTSVYNLSQSNMVNLSESDFMIMNTPEGELYDKGFIDSLIKADVTEKNIKRESKAYSYKEQLAELELKRELEKSGKLKKSQPQLNKKQQELVNQKLIEEAAIRNNTMKIRTACSKYFTALNSYVEGSQSDAYVHYYSILKVISLHAKSLISGPFALQTFLTLQKCLKLRSNDLIFSWISFRTVVNQDLVPDDWKAEPLTAAKIRALASLADFYKNQKGIAVKNFAFFYELLSSYLQDVSSNEEYIVMALDIIRLFFEAAKSENSEIRSVEKPFLDVLRLCIHAVQCLTSPNLMNKCTITAQTVSQVCLQYCSEDSEIMNSAIVFLLTSLETPVVAVHETCLTCLWELRSGLACLHIDAKNTFAKYIWMCLHSEIPCIREKAEIFWPYIKVDDNEKLLKSVLPYTSSSEQFVYQCAAAGVVHCISISPNLIHDVCQYLTSEYRQCLKPLMNNKDAFGRTLTEVDNWQNRMAIGHCLAEIVEFTTKNEVVTLLQFFVDVALSDRNSDVRDQMLRAAIALVDKHSKEELTYMLNYFDDFLGTAPKCAEYDNARLGVVILMGTLARELNEGNPKIKPIMGQLIMTLNTPSEMVQKAVANCLSPLVSSIKDEAPKFVDQLVHVLLSSDSYAERRGAAYGIAGIIKGLGVVALKQFNLMEILQTAVQNKELPRQREGGLLAFEMMMQVLGRIFEIYIVRILPDMLQCFSDNNIHVRNAANECGKVIMSNLTAHGVKLILPSLMDGVVSELWRTKCGAVDLLGSMAYCAPNQLSICLPSIVPKLIDILNDTHTKVQKSGLQALKQIGSVIKNPEIRSFVPHLIDALQDPSTKTQSSLQLLANTNFIHYMDAASLALIIPVVRRGFHDRSIETRKMSGMVLTKICSLTSRKDLEPYLDDLLVDLKKRLMDPVPEIRKVSAQALGSVVKAMGKTLGNELLSWFKGNLYTNTNTVDRSGAAQGLCEVAGAMGIDVLSFYIEEFIPISQSQNSEACAKSGALIFFHFVAGSFPELFAHFIPRIILAVLKGIADEFEYVRDAAYTVGQSIVNDFADKATVLLLPELELYIFDENWRIRSSSLSLLCDLLLRITGTAHGMSEGSHSEKSLNMLGSLLGMPHRNKILSEIYMARNDSVLTIAQNALRIWKIFVANTPKILREILPTLLSIIITLLSSSDKGIRKIAGLTLGDAVRKLGESTLVEVIAIIKNELKSEVIDRRKGICFGLNEIIAFSTKDYLIAMFDPFAEILLTLFTDDDPDVRQAAALAFAEFVNVLGTARINESLLPKLLQNISSDQRALDSLLKIIQVLGGTILSQILPSLLSDPNAEISVISAICNAGGDFVARYLKLLISSAASCLEKSNCSTENLEKCADMLVAVSNEGSFSTVCNHLITFVYSCLKDENPQRVMCAVALMSQYIKVFPHVQSDCAAEFIKLSVKLALLSDDNILTVSWTCLDNYVKRFSSADHILLLNLFVQSLRGIKYEHPNVTYIPGFCLRGKGIKHVIPLYREGIVNGNPSDMELALESLHQLIIYVSAEALQSSVMTVSGFLIRVLGERFSVTIKSLVLRILIEMLNKVGDSLRLFSPQLQHTFLRGLSSTSREIRFLSACALRSLSKLKPRIDVICTGILKRLEEAPPEETYTDTYLFAFMVSVVENPNRLTKECMDGIKAFVCKSINDESLCTLSGGVLGAIHVSAEKEEASLFLLELPDKIRSSSSPAKQGLYVALYTLMQYRPELAIEHFELLKKFILNSQTHEPSPLSYSILRCLGFLIKVQLSTNFISDVEPLSVFCELLKDSSAEAKLIVLSFLAYFESLNIPDSWLKVYLTTVVLGTQEKAFNIKNVCDRMLAEFLRNPENEARIKETKSLLSKNCENVLNDFYSNSLSRILNAKDYKIYVPKMVDLDETILLE